MANRHNNFLNSINCDKGFKKEIDPSVSVHSDEKASESDIRIDEFENRNEIQETCDNIIQEMMLEEVVDNDVLKGNRNANKATLKIFAEMPGRFSSESKIQEVVGSDVLEIQEEVVNNVTDKVSLDVKNGDVIDSEEGIKANVKEMFENVIDDDDVDKKIENESDDDVKEVEKEPVVDVQRFEWKPGWRYCSGKKSRIIIERDLTEPDRIIGELLQPDYLKLIGLGLEDCIEDIVAQSFFGDALFKDGKNIRLCYPLEKLQSDVVGRSFHNVHIGRNFDEDQRKPLDEGSGPCWTVSDENIRVGTSVYVRQEPESDYSLTRNVPIQPATTPLFKFRGGSMDGCYAARFSEAVNVKSDAGKSDVMGFLLETSLQGYVGTSLTHAKGGQQGNDNNLAAGSSTATHSFGQQSVEHNFGYQNLIFQSEGYDIWMVPWLDGFANCFTLHVCKGNVDFTTKHVTCIKSEFYENHVASNKVGDEDLTQSGLTIKVGVIEDRTNKKEAIQPATVSYYDEDSYQRMFTRGSCFKQVIFSIPLFHQSTTIEELNFDVDGYYIKTGASCLKELMKFHKEGFTSVLGAAKSFGQSKLLRVELHFVVPTCENMITGASMTSFLQFIFDSFD